MEQAMVVVFPEDDPRVCQVSFRQNVPLLILQAASIEAGQMRFGERKLGEVRKKSGLDLGILKIHMAFMLPMFVEKHQVFCFSQMFALNRTRSSLDG